MVALAFVDVESVRLGTGHGSALWELCIIARDATGHDTDYLWHLRPSLEFAEANALRIGGYYERCKVAERPVGSGMILSHPKYRGKRQAMGSGPIAREVAALLDGALIVGANPWFDAGHIDVFLREHGQALSADYHYQNVGSLVNGYLAGRGEASGMKPLKLSDAARAVGLDPGKYAAHTALDDARLARDIYRAVIGGTS